MSGPSNQAHIEDYQAVDRISSLPDAVICHILSFMPTKSALKTSVLAKRWMYIWRNVPVLDFSEMPRLKCKKTLTWQQKIYFRNFVDKVLLHNDAFYVQILRFYLFQVDDYYYLISWLRAIMWRKIREITIYSDLLPRQPISVPLPIFFLSCERLVVLKLDGNFIIDVPKLLHLPNLEIIRLAGIQFPSDEFMKSLLLGCPVLKELEIVYYYGISMLYVESLTLKKLEIVAPLAHPRVPCVVIKAPNLTYLRIENPLTQYDICDLSLLVEADLEISDIDDDKYAFEILSKVSSVHTLQLGPDTELLFMRVSNPPIFGKLTCLQLDWVNESALQILEFTPKLKSLTVIRVIRWDYSYEDKSEPECLPCLENVELCNFKGKTEEMRFVAYVLEAASVLKEMKVSLEPLNRRKERDACQKLLKLPRSSIACQVKLDFRKF